MSLLIRNALVIDPITNLDRVLLDIYIEDQQIVQIAPRIEEIPGMEVYDAHGLWAAPGLVDIHVHLRQPGREDKETVRTGTLAAAAGGFAAVACMPNTHPVLDGETVLGFLQQVIQQDAVVDVYPIGAISKGLQGEELAELTEMAKAGVRAFSDDGHCVNDGFLMRQALEYAKMLDVPLICHAEDAKLADGGVMHEGYWSTVLGLPPISPVAEEAIIARDLLLAEKIGARLHIAHVSTAGSVDLLRWGKARGIRVTGEVTPHHLTLTDEAVSTFDTNTKVNPPLRSIEDVQAVRRGLADGTIDCIASDHAPHTREEKEQEYIHAPFGLIGLETTVPVVMSELVGRGHLAPLRAVEALSTKPASILGLEPFSIAPGRIANITLIDPNLEKTVKPDEFYSKSCNTPFADKRLKGWPKALIYHGQIIMRDGVVGD
jgi:dihydroorotase